MFGPPCLWFILVFVSVLVPITTTTSKARIYRDNGNTYPQRRAISRSCDTEQMEMRLTILENKVAEKSDVMIHELSETNQRLRELEMHISDVQSNIEVFRSDLVNISVPKLLTRSQEEPIQLTGESGKRIEDLTKGMQLVIATLRKINLDIDSVKKNLSTSFSIRSSIPTEVKGQNDITHRSTIARNCRDIQDSGTTSSGIYQIQPAHVEKPFLVFCDMDTHGGGWTYIQSRFDGYQVFSLDWNDYKLGFGNIGGEFWLGLEHIYQLTGHDVNELLIELVDFDKKTAYAHYNSFGIGSEDEGYALRILEGYSGDAGDSLLYHTGSRFSTKDRDQDKWIDGNCAKAHSGAWWYRSCDTSNLNGQYLEGSLPEDLTYQGMYWAEFGGSRYSLAESRMMVRPRRMNQP